MTLLFRLITRVLMMGLGYGIACLGAGGFIGFAIYNWKQKNPQSVELATDPIWELWQMAEPFFAGAFATWGAGTSAILPAVALGLLTEAFSIRSLYAYLGAGALIALGVLASSNVYTQGEVPPQTDILISLAAGFVAGTLYWLIAGRGAGGWRGV